MRKKHGTVTYGADRVTEVNKIYIEINRKELWKVKVKVKVEIKVEVEVEVEVKVEIKVEVKV